MRNPEPILETQLVAATQAAEPALAAGFSVGRVLSRTASVWWKHLLPFTAMSVVVYAPFAAIFAVFFGMASPLRAPASPFPEEDFRKLFVAFGLVWAFTIVAAVIQAGAVTFGTVRHLSGERARFLEMLRAGFRRGLPVVAVGFVLWIAVVLGMLLLFVPGLLMLVASSVAIPAAVVERPGVIGAIKRSFALTRGCRGALFAAGFVIVVALWVLAAVVQVGASVLVAVLLPPQQALVGTMVASQLGNVFFSALPLVGVSVAYHELRVAKEGVDTAALAKVFE